MENIIVNVIVVKVHLMPDFFIFLPKKRKQLEQEIVSVKAALHYIIIIIIRMVFSNAWLGRAIKHVCNFYLFSIFLLLITQYVRITNYVRCKKGKGRGVLMIKLFWSDFAGETYHSRSLYFFSHFDGVYFSFCLVYYQTCR